MSFKHTHKYMLHSKFFTDRLHDPNTLENTDLDQYFSNLNVLKNLLGTL